MKLSSVKSLLPILLAKMFSFADFFSFFFSAEEILGALGFTGFLTFFLILIFLGSGVILGL